MLLNQLILLKGGAVAIYSSGFFRTSCLRETTDGSHACAILGQWFASVPMILFTLRFVFETINHFLWGNLRN